MSDVSERFQQALHHLDDQADAGPMVDLTAPDAVLSKLGGHRDAQGPDGARTFWDEYRSVFATVSTEFTGSVDGEHGSAMEWISRGTLPDGTELTYRGVTVIEVAGEQVSGVRTYYDSAAFLAPSARA